jgi:hydroxypyruvate isomerase
VAQLSVCIELIFTEYPFFERITKVGEVGLPAVEFWFTGQNPDNPAEEEEFYAKIGEVAKKAGVVVSGFVLNSPDGSITGSLVRPEDREDYLKRLEQVVKLAKLAGCKTIITCSGNTVPDRTNDEQVESIIETLTAAAPMAAAGGVTLVLEPLNTLVDHEGYFLDSSALAAAIVREIGHPNIKMLYDVYHMQIMEGNIIHNIRQNIDIIGHFHSAGVPGRHELTSGELNYPDIIAEVDALSYNGFFGLEYEPLMPSEQSLLLLKDRLGL